MPSHTVHIRCDPIPSHAERSLTLFNRCGVSFKVTARRFLLTTFQASGGYLSPSDDWNKCFLLYDTTRKEKLTATWRRRKKMMESTKRERKEKLLGTSGTQRSFPPTLNEDVDNTKTQIKTRLPYYFFFTFFSTLSISIIYYIRVRCIFFCCLEESFFRQKNTHKRGRKITKYDTKVADDGRQ